MRRSLDGQPADAKKVKRLEARVDEAERARDKVVRRITAWRPRLVAAETAAAHFAERHADEINAETLPSLAQAEQRFRDALTQLQAASQRLDDEVMAVDAIQGVVQGAQRVLSGGGDVGQLLTLVGRVQAQPLMRLPDTLAVLAEEAGMFTTVNEGGRMIPANLGRPGGPVDVNALQAAQARRIDELAAQEA